MFVYKGGGTVHWATILISPLNMDSMTVHLTEVLSCCGAKAFFTKAKVSKAQIDPSFGIYYFVGFNELNGTKCATMTAGNVQLFSGTAFTVMLLVMNRLTLLFGLGHLPRISQN